MPEYSYLRGIPLERLVNVLTVTAALDYQGNSERLWRAAIGTYLDRATSWLFDMVEVARRDIPAVRRAMSVHGFTGRYPGNNARYVWRLCRTFASLYGGSPIGLLEKYGHDAGLIHRTGKGLGDLPGLTGPKILPLWLRVLKDVASLDLKNMEAVCIPVDVHIARATLRVIYLSNRRPDVPAQREAMVSAWSEICRAVGRPEIYPLALDEPLWLLSRHGCSGTDDGSRCHRAGECVVAEFCVLGVPPPNSAPAPVPDRRHPQRRA
ncbi:MAG: hypothetical protein NUV93_07695 [Firmicutes bacterium]|jgi:endonuclease III|nr:hypothetical protein [Bacillota bacterium]